MRLLSKDAVHVLRDPMIAHVILREFLESEQY